MKKLFLTGLSLIVSFIAVSALAAPKGPPMTPRMTQAWPCMADVQKICTEHKPNDHEAVMKCLEANLDKVSPACKDSMEKIKKAVQRIEAACHDDMQKVCKDVSPQDHKAMHDCLLKNKDKLSGQCKTIHERMAQRMPGPGMRRGRPGPGPGGMQNMPPSNSSSH